MFGSSKPRMPLVRQGQGAPRGNYAAQSASRDEGASFQEFSASELYCPKCKHAMPVKQHLLLYLPGGEVYDYVCARCNTSVGSRRTG
jgi:hypothetical protein